MYRARRVPWGILAIPVILAVCAIAIPTNAFATVYYVHSGGNDANPGTSWAQAKATVQAAIDTASESDEIWIAAGAYAEHLNNRTVGGLAVNVALYGGFAGDETIRDLRDPEANPTILDGQDTGIVFTITGLASRATRIDGFRIAHGYATGFTGDGGGLAVVASAPTIANCVIRDNLADGTGGGIRLFGYKTTPPAEQAVITENVFVNNRAVDGGAIGLIGASPEITGNRIARNYVSGYGGGIGCWTSDSAKVCSPLIANNAIYENSANFVEDTWLLGGGGIFATSDRVDGQPVPFGIAAPTIVDNLIAANGATRSGGGIAVIDSNIEAATIANNTIVANNGSGIYWSQTFPTIANNLIAYNTWGLERENEGPTPATVRYNDLFGNTVRREAADWLGIADLTGTDGNISADPKLVGYTTGRLHLQPDSPCVDAGADDMVGSGRTDIDGGERILGGAVDIGADETDGTWWDPTVPVIHVHPGGDDSMDGLSWATARATVGAGIDRAYEAGGELWVAEGTYAGNFLLPAWVHAYGGFLGDETDREERDPAGHPTVLDGGGLPSVVQSALAGYLVSALDGFTVRHGGEPTGGDPFDPGGPGGRGGGVDCNVSSPILANNVIRDNSLGGPAISVNAAGGGIGLYGSYPLISDNVIRDNEALHWSSQGGGIYMTLSMPVIEYNEIRSNHAPYGAAIYAWNSWPTIAGNMIVENSHYLASPVYSGSVWGALDIELSPGFTIERNLVQGNVAGTGAGITVQSTHSGRIESNLILDNIAQNASGLGGIGGGAYVQLLQNPDGRIVLDNNTFTGNTATDMFTGEQGGALAVVMLSGAMDVANNLMAFNSSGIWRHPGSTTYAPTLVTNDLFNGTQDYINLPAGSTDTHVDPQFVDRPGGDYHLQASSECVDVGTNGWADAAASDMEGAPRIQDGDYSGSPVVDMGAYEYSPDFDGDGQADWSDPDDDDDGVLDGSDCAPLDAGAWTAPAEVAGLLVTGIGPTTVGWQEQGTDLYCDVAGGTVSAMQVDGGVTGAACLADDETADAWDDSRPDPGAGESYYYIVRVQNACGDGTWGHASGGEERIPAAACP